MHLGINFADDETDSEDETDSADETDSEGETADPTSKRQGRSITARATLANMWSGGTVADPGQGGGTAAAQGTRNIGLQQDTASVRRNGHGGTNTSPGLQMSLDGWVIRNAPSQCGGAKGVPSS